MGASSQLSQEIDDLFLNSRTHQEELISSFLDIAVGHTIETARKFLQTTNWNIEEAIDFIILNNIEEAINLIVLNNSDASSLYHYDQVEPSRASEESDSRLFPPPFGMIFEGSFENAKSVSSRKNQWLLVNLQSRTEFASNTLNQDVWSDETVLRTVESNFILLQVYDDTTEGQKVSSFYKIESVPPVVLLIDPITGKKMRMWSGVIEAESFVEDLMKPMDAGPQEHIDSLTTNRCPGTEVDEVRDPGWGSECEKEDACSSSNYSSQTAGFELKEFEFPDLSSFFSPPYSREEFELKEFEYPDLTEARKEDSEESDWRLFAPPFGMLFKGSFEDAKYVSSRKNQWLLVNLQSRTEFASNTLNRDVWSDVTVLRTVESNFIILQVYDTTEGQKVSSFYEIDYVPPMVLLIDPITGRKMRMWSGVIEAESFVEDLMRFMDAGPRPGTELDASSSSNYSSQTEDYSSGEESEEVDEEETCISRDHTDQAAVPCWGKEFELKEFEFPDLTKEPKEESESRLSSLFPPPFGMLFEGSFEDAEYVSTRKNQWLLVNLQSRTKIASNTLNQDVWSDETVLRTVESNFILFQVYDDTIEGQNVSRFYKIYSVPPVVLLIDPITGQKMRMWSGVIEAESFVEDLMKFMDAGPQERIASLERNRLPGTEADEVPAPGWDDEFKKEDACSSSNYSSDTEASSSGEKSEEVDEEEEETCTSRDHADQTPAPSYSFFRLLLRFLCV